MRTYVHTLTHHRSDQLAIHVIEKYFTSRVNTMRKTFEEDAALLRKMRRTGGLSNSEGLDAGKLATIERLEEQMERKEREREVGVV